MLTYHGTPKSAQTQYWGGLSKDPAPTFDIESKKLWLKNRRFCESKGVCFVFRRHSQAIYPGTFSIFCRNISKGRIVELITFIIFKAAVIQANPGMASPWMMAIPSDPSPEKVPLSTTISQVLLEEILLCQRKGALSLFPVKQRQNACADPGSKVQERSYL